MNSFNKEMTLGIFRNVNFDLGAIFGRDLLRPFVEHVWIFLAHSPFRTFWKIFEISSEKFDWMVFEIEI